MNTLPGSHVPHGAEFIDKQLNAYRAPLQRPSLSSQTISDMPRLTPKDYFKGPVLLPPISNTKTSPAKRSASTPPGAADQSHAADSSDRSGVVAERTRLMVAGSEMVARLGSCVTLEDIEHELRYSAARLRLPSLDSAQAENIAPRPSGGLAAPPPTTPTASTNHTAAADSPKTAALDKPAENGTAVDAAEAARLRKFSGVAPIDIVALRAQRAKEPGKEKAEGNKISVSPKQGSRVLAGIDTGSEEEDEEEEEGGDDFKV